MSERKTYAVIGTLYAQVSCDIEASSPEEAAEEGWNTFAPSICHQCTRDVELGELHQIAVLTEDFETELLVQSTGGLTGEAEELRRQLEEANARAEAAKAKLKAVAEILSAYGCDCECDRHREEHTTECDRCLACRIGDQSIGGAPPND